MTIVVRENLDARTALSKSEIVDASWCERRSFFRRTQPRPWNVTPSMAYGSALDAGVEQVMASRRAGMEPDFARVEAAIAEVILREEQPVDGDDVLEAVRRFDRDVVPEHDWAFCGLQVSLTADFGEDIGPVNGHPDLILANGDLFDVKSSEGNGKRPEDIWNAPELPVYAALYERTKGERLRSVGYISYLRPGPRRKDGKWSTLSLPVDDDIVATGIEELRRQANRRRAFDLYAAKGVDPAAWLTPARVPKHCIDCGYLDICTTGQRNVRRLQGMEEVPDAA